MSGVDLPPGVERCSCDEALMLRAEVSRLRALLDTAAERDRDLCAEVDAANELLQYIWDQYDNEDELSADTLERLNAHLADKPTSVAAQADPLHPSGRCTCGGEGSCDWCMTHCLHCGSGFPGGVPIRSAAEQRMLDAMARADTEELVALVDGELPNTPLWEIAACRAELARREANR